MRRSLAVLSAVLFLSAAILFTMSACTPQQVKDTSDKIQYLVGGAAPLLPPPFGLIAGAIAGLAGVVSSIAAGKIKGAAIATGKEPNGLATFFSDHQYLYPAISALLGFLQSAHVINISQDQIASIMAGIGLPPMLAQMYFSKKADAVTPLTGVVTQVTTTAPPTP